MAAWKLCYNPNPSPSPDLVDGRLEVVLTLTLTLALTSSMGVWKLCVLASAAVLSAGFSSLIQPVSTWSG